MSCLVMLFYYSQCLGAVAVVNIISLMEYITLCLDGTNEVVQWYVRHN